MVKPIRANDSFQPVDSKLEKRYNTGLFDFSYFLSIALNNEFLSQSIFTLSRRELDRLKSALKNLAEILKILSFMPDLRKLMEDKIETIEKMEPSIKKYRGRIIGERSKLILLWTQILQKKRIKSLKIWYHQEGKEITEEAQGIIEEIDWVDYYGLLRWFYSKLENCSYASYIEPIKPNQQEEIKYSKSLWEKTYDNYRMKARDALWFFMNTQEYFAGEDKELPLKLGRDDFFHIEAYPVILVNFKKDSIEIGELRENGILIKKVRFADKKKVRSEKLNKGLKITSPTVIFPDGEKFTPPDYTPPLTLSPGLLNQYLDEFMAEILRISE